MLAVNSFDFYAEHSHGFQTYEDATALLQGWYNNADKNVRLLMEWKNISFSEEMRKIPNDPKVHVFNKFVAPRKGLQKKLYKDYHHDRYLRDRLITAIDFPAPQDTLRYRMPRTAQHVIQRTIRILSDKTITAGSLVAHTATNEGLSPYNFSTDEGDESLYSLGQ